MCISGVWHHEFHVFTSNTSICDIYVTLSLPWCNEAVTTRSPIKETFPVKLKSQIQYRIALAARNGCNENNEVTTAASAAHSEGREEARLRRASRLWNRKDEINRLTHLTHLIHLTHLSHHLNQWKGICLPPQATLGFRSSGRVWFFQAEVLASGVLAEFWQSYWPVIPRSPRKQPVSGQMHQIIGGRSYIRRSGSGAQAPWWKNELCILYYIIWFLAAPRSWRRHKELKKAPSKNGRRHKELWKSCQGNLCTWAHVPEPSPKPKYLSLCSCIMCPWLSRDLAALHEAVTQMDEAVLSLNGGWHFMEIFIQWCRMNGYDLNWMAFLDTIWIGWGRLILEPDSSLSEPDSNLSEWTGVEKSSMGSNILYVRSGL